MKREDMATATRIPRTFDDVDRLLGCVREEETDGFFGFRKSQSCFPTAAELALLKGDWGRCHQQAVCAYRGPACKECF